MLAQKTRVGYKKLAVYDKAKNLVLFVYKITAHFPKTEAYGLVAQVRRAAISVLANVVEGYAKESSAEFARFLTIAIGSLTEVEVYFDLSFELGFIQKAEFEKGSSMILEVKKLLYATRKSIRERSLKRF